MGAVFKTVSEVRAANIAAGGCFFSRPNMLHVGDTLRSFALWRDPQGELYLYRKPSAIVKGASCRDDEPQVRQVGFDPKLGAFWLIRSSGRMVPMGSEATREFYIRLKKESS
jgi:hypothetical protein